MDEITWRRGRPLSDGGTRNLRGGYSFQIEAMTADGQLRIVSEPDVHPACCGCANCETRYAA